MSRDSNGDYTLPAGVNPVVAATTITDDWANTTLADVATALTDSWDRQGRGAPLANLSMGSFKLTTLAAATAAADAPKYSQVINQDTATIASAGTVDLANTIQSDVVVTGTATITSFGTGASAGVRKFVTFTGALTLTHGSNLICPNSANISITAGNGIIVRSEGSNVWRVQMSPTFPITIPDGTVSAPGLSFTSDTDNGLYRIGTNRWGLSAGATNVLDLAASGVTITSSYTEVYGGGLSGTGLLLQTQSSASGTADSLLKTGTASTGSSGSVAISTGNGLTLSGSVTLTPGATTQGGSGACQAGHVTITSGNATSSTNGKPGNVNISTGPGYSYTTNGNINFKVYTSGLVQTTQVQIRSRENMLVYCTDAGSPTITSGAGTGATIVGTNYGFIVTLGTSPGTTIVLALAAWGGGANPTNSAVVVAGSTNTAYRTGASATTTAVTVTTSATPTAGDKIHVILNWFDAAL